MIKTRRVASRIPPDARVDLVALVAYLILAIVLTYPLILHFTTHVAGDGRDDPALAWNLWWVPYSILHLGASPISTDYMFYPIGLDLAFYTLTYLNALLAIPVQFAVNLVSAANANLLLSFTLSGFGAYLLVKYLLRVRVPDSPPGDASIALAALAAGALYAFSSNKLLYASLGQFNIASSHWIPFYVLFLIKLTRNPRSLRCAVLLGLFLLLQALSEFIFASFLIIFSAIYVTSLLVARRGRLGARLVLGLGVAAAVFSIPMLPILAAMFQDMRVEGDFIQQGLGFADVFSSDLLGLFVPSHLHPLFGGIEQQFFHFAYTNFAYLGFSALALAILALWKVPPARPWGLLGALFILITLGPDLRIDGAAVPAPFLPFNWLLEIPLVKGNRYPSRWSVMVTLCLAVLAGYGLLFASKKAKGKSKKWALLLPFAFIFFTCLEHLSVPLPLSDFAIPDVYRTIAADKGNYSVLEIPLAWRNGFRMTGTQDAAMMYAQWYQTQHQHPILGGNTSRNPELKFQYFAEAPVINSLIAVETGHTLDAATLRADKQLAPAVLGLFGVRYVVWHSPRDAQNAAALAAARAYVEQVWPVTRFYDATDETGETIAYRVDQTPAADQPSLSASDPLARLAFGEGWGAVGGQWVWATRSDARLFVVREAPVDAALTFRFYSPLPNQTLRVKVNGNALGALATAKGWSVYSMNVPGAIWRAGMNEITLAFDGLAPVGGVREGDFAVGTTGVSSPVSIVVRSAGSEIGDFAHIYVNGVDAAPNQIGYNLVVLDARTGMVEKSAAFNTFASEAESARLAQFIAGIPNGKIVAAAVRDEASAHLTAKAVDALRSIGAVRDMSGPGHWRWSHAIVGVKGAASGAALEAASETWPAQLVVGVGAMEPNVAAGLEWLQVQPR